MLEKKKIVIKKLHACNKINFSSKINEVIRTILNPLFFYENISHAQKTPKALKSTKTHKSATKQKYKIANKPKKKKKKNPLKKHLKGK